MFKLGRCDLYLRFKITIFVKHIFHFFSQTAAQIMMKFGLYMHLSKVSQVCSNQVRMTYFHRIMLMSFLVVTWHAYLQCITTCHYVISHFRLLLNSCTDLLWFGESLGILVSYVRNSVTTTVPAGTFIFLERPWLSQCK